MSVRGDSMAVTETKFENYNKIEDVMMFLGKNAVLKMNLNLFHSTEKNGRISYHSEVRYYNEKIQDRVVNIKRSFDYFMSIENIRPMNGEKQYIMIRQEDIFLLRRVLVKVYDYFYDNFDKLFVKRKNIVSVDPNFKPIEYNGLPMGKYLIFTPDVTENINGEKVGCIKLNLSSPNSFVCMSLNKLSGFVESISNADMFLYAQNMSNYMGNPGYGTNLFDMSSTQEIKDAAIGPSGRKLSSAEKAKEPPKGSTSYFNKKMNELGG